MNLGSPHLKILAGAALALFVLLDLCLALGSRHTDRGLKERLISAAPAAAFVLLPMLYAVAYGLALVWEPYAQNGQFPPLRGHRHIASRPEPLPRHDTPRMDAGCTVVEVPAEEPFSATYQGVLPPLEGGGRSLGTFEVRNSNPSPTEDLVVRVTPAATALGVGQCVTVIWNLPTGHGFETTVRKERPEPTAFVFTRHPEGGTWECGGYAIDVCTVRTREAHYVMRVSAPATP